MGLAAKKYTDKGALVPDDVVIGIIRERLEQEDCKKKADIFLTDSPRTVPQAKALDEMGIEIDAVISIEVPDEEIVERMSGRRVCENAVRHITLFTTPAGDGSTCDKCGGGLTVRHDDTPEVVLDRLRVYHEQTEPLKEYYQKTGKLKALFAVKKCWPTRQGWYLRRLRNFSLKQRRQTAADIYDTLEKWKLS